MKRILLALILVGIAHWLSGQITTNTNFKVNSNNPIDNRMTIATLGDTSTISFPFEGLLVHVNDADSYYKYNGATWEIFDPGGGAVSSVNSQTGAVVLDADDIDDTSTTNKFTTADDISKLAGIESGATSDQSDAEIETAYNNQVDVISQSEAEAGTSTTVRRWTSERVAQAIAAQASGGSSTISKESDISRRTYVGNTNTVVPELGAGRKVYIGMFGQSNADGQSPTGDTTRNERILEGLSGGTEVLFDRTNNNPGFQAAKEHLRYYPRDTIVIFLVATGGTPISSWYSGGALRTEAETKLSAHGNPDLEAVYWMQGEADRDNSGINAGLTGVSADSNYYRKFVDSVYTWITTSAWANTETPIILGTLYDQADAQYVGLTRNNAIDSLGNGDISNIRVADFNDLGSFDGLHYNGTGIDTMGWRYFDQALQLRHISRPFSEIVELRRTNQLVSYSFDPSDYADGDTLNWEQWEGVGVVRERFSSKYLKIEAGDADSAFTVAGRIARWIDVPYQPANYSLILEWNHKVGTDRGGVILQLHNGVSTNGWIVANVTNDMDLYRISGIISKKADSANGGAPNGSESRYRLEKIRNDTIRLTNLTTDEVYWEYEIPGGEKFEDAGGIGFVSGISSTGDSIFFSNITLDIIQTSTTSTDGNKIDFSDSPTIGWEVSGRQVKANLTGGLNNVGLNLPGTIFTSTNNPLTTNGTINLAMKTQTANTFLLGPASGGAAAPTFRALGLSDIPETIAFKIGGNSPGGSNIDLGTNNNVSLRLETNNTVRATFAGTGGTTLSDQVTISGNGLSVSLGGPFTPSIGVINAQIGFRLNNAGVSGNYLRGNGTNFVSSAIQESDLPARPASDINIADSGGYFTGTEVETSLQEIGADLAAITDTDDQIAAEVTYSNGTSGLTATDVQAAIDETVAAIPDNITDLTISSDVSFASNKITNLAPGTADTDAINKSQLDTLTETLTLAPSNGDTIVLTHKEQFVVMDGTLGDPATIYFDGSGVPVGTKIYLIYDNYSTGLTLDRDDDADNGNFLQSGGAGASETLSLNGSGETFLIKLSSSSWKQMY